MTEAYLTIKNESSAELIVERSRFIASCYCVQTEEEASGKLSQTKKAYSAANHHCYAYVLTPDGGITRNSDDREPAKTAGYPILEAIRGRKLFNTLVIVTRYFGGIKLGTGGLARAYGQAASLALDKSGRLNYVYSAEFDVNTEYGTMTILDRLIGDYGIITEKNFDDKVTLKIVCPAVKAEELQQKIREISSGEAQIGVPDFRYHSYEITNI